MRLAAYIALMVATFAAAGALRSELAAFCLLAEVAALLLCLAQVLLLRRGVFLRLELASPRVAAGAAGNVALVIENRAPVPAFCCEVPLVTRNLWGSAICSVAVHIAVPGRWRAPGRARQTFTLGVLHCAGPLEVAAGPVTVRDALGLFRLRAGAAAKAALLVMPAGPALEVHAAGAAGSPTGSEAPAVGMPEPPDMADVRPYQPGDSLHAIHWKLSARTDEVMARTFEPEAPRSAVLRVDCGNVADRDPERLGAVLEAAAAVLRGMEHAGVACAVTAQVRAGDKTPAQWRAIAPGAADAVVEEIEYLVAATARLAGDTGAAVAAPQAVGEKSADRSGSAAAGPSASAAAGSDAGAGSTNVGGAASGRVSTYGAHGPSPDTFAAPDPARMLEVRSDGVLVRDGAVIARFSSHGVEDVAGERGLWL